MAKPFAKLLSMLTPKRRWAQFSLATMFVVVTVLCVWLSVVVNRAHRQRDAVAAIEALGGHIIYTKPGEEASETFPKPFLRRWLSRYYFDDVRAVLLAGTQVTDAGLAHLHSLTGLQALSLMGTQATDSGLAHLQGLTGLRQLWLRDTQVTDAGLIHLHGLTALHVLDLGGTQITDTGLTHLQGLMGLDTLSLSGTQVTDAGVVKLREALPKCQIFWP
jgi:hypothetical protein